jgi:hypothetical protein
MVSKKSGRKTFTTAERKALSIRMKAYHAKKKYNKNQAKIKFPDVPEKIEGKVMIDPCANNLCQTPAVDIGKIEERAYHRGLITAMEIILREIR